jgi:BirA family biotin operon repressor/biotin-[acetyl-CoA-carboxylase] ligase
MDPDRVGLVSLAAGVAMAEAASDLSAREVRCKWPNDLVSEGSKVGGILGETEIREGRLLHVVVGIGVNLEAPDEVPEAGGIGRVVEETLLTSYLRRFRALLQGPPSEIRDRWRAISDTLGRRVEATSVGGDVVRGVAADLDETGALLVETEAGPARVAFGEIQHLDVKG